MSKIFPLNVDPTKQWGKNIHSRVASPEHLTTYNKIAKIMFVEKYEKPKIKPWSEMFYAYVLFVIIYGLGHLSPALTVKGVKVSILFPIGTFLIIIFWLVFDDNMH